MPLCSFCLLLYPQSLLLSFVDVLTKDMESCICTVISSHVIQQRAGYMNDSQSATSNKLTVIQRCNMAQHNIEVRFDTREPA